MVFGLKVQRKAEQEKRSPQEVVDEYATQFRELAEVWDISNDDFIRTTEKRHRETVEAFWKKVDRNGHIYKKIYEGWYCVPCESFKTEKDLVDGKCPDHNVVPEHHREENYFFKLTAFEEKLKELFSAQTDFVVPDDKRNEMVQILESGLEDVSISRSTKTLAWGIPVPGDASQVMYVWFDALVNYISAIGYGHKKENAMRAYWPCDIHFVGKEINRFHSLLWPAMLLAAGVEPPRQVAVHGWITVEGKKMSKTVGNVIDPFDLVERYGVDPVRYFMGREMPLYRDGDFSYARLEERYNNDLANEFGNLLHRTASMTERYADGLVPPVHEFDVREYWTGYRAAMESLRFDEALHEAWRVVRALNKHIDDTEPWKLAKIDSDAVARVLYVLLEGLRHVAWMLLPFMPTTAMVLFERLGTSFMAQAQMSLSDASKWGGLKSGGKVQTGEPLFPRIEVKH
ncbi:methionine--tRNA ligase [Candidatus Uhrbacteria bacterium]|nr:methionine--tRNA ligase [Candidatus Uhrbacteria bacterium]